MTKKQTVKNKLIFKKNIKTMFKNRTYFKTLVKNLIINDKLQNRHKNKKH